MSVQSRPLSAPASDLWDYLTGDEDHGAREYYMGDGLGYGEVWGSGAARLGVEEITARQFAHLANGRSLDGRTQRIQTNNGKHVSGIDLTFSVPKSVSLEKITASPERAAEIDAVIREAARVAFMDAEARALVCRVPVKTPVAARADGRSTRTQGSATERVPGELVGFVAVHDTARPTHETVERGSPPDMHAHVHVFVFNQAWVADPDRPAGGKWRSVDDLGFKRTAETREAVFSGEVARGLEALGYRIDYHTDRKGRVSWELGGSSPTARRFFSTNARRTDGLGRKFERDYGRPPTDVEMRDLMRVNRLPKEKTPDREPTREEYLAAAARAGIKLEPHEQSARPQATATERQGELLERLAAPSGLCREDAIFDRASIRPAVARCAVGLGFSPQELDEITDRLVAEDLVPVRMGATPGPSDYFTTRENVERELFIDATAELKAVTAAPAPSAAAVDRAIAHSPVTLDNEQIEAVRAACAGNAWANIEGWAGTGKTTALKTVVAAYRDDLDEGAPTADRVIVVCTAAHTAIETSRKLDADRWYSVEGFASAVQKGRLTPTERTLVLVDEAVMVDTPREAALLQAAGPAQVVNIGDSRQMQGIGSSGWYEAQADGLGRVTLTEVHRQTDPTDVRDLGLVRLGKAGAALRSFEERGRLHMAENRAERMGQLVGDYKGYRDRGYQPSDLRVIIDTANHEVDTANRLIQDDRLARGELEGPGLEVRATDEGRTWRLYEGDEVLFLTNYYARGRVQVRNGVSGQVLDVDEQRRVIGIRTEEGERVSVQLAEEDHTQPVGLGYAAHAMKIQGGEVPIVLAMPGNKTTSLEAGYSQLTRAVDEVHVYVDHETHGPDPEKALAEAWARPAPKRTAISQLGQEAPAPEQPEASAERTAEPSERAEATPVRPAEGEGVALAPVPNLEPPELDDLPGDPELLSEEPRTAEEVNRNDDSARPLSEERTLDDVWDEIDRAWEQGREDPGLGDDFGIGY